MGPHSLQVAPDGALWITLALGNQLARFDPVTRAFEILELATRLLSAHAALRYARAASGTRSRPRTTWACSIPRTGEQRELRLPARTWARRSRCALMPLLLWLGRQVDLRGAAADGDGFTMPVPYGIDIAPDGGVWFSQLNENRIGRVDPESSRVEMIDTPFAAPRRLRFDSKGRLWIPGFSASLLARFDPASGSSASWELPIEPRGSETPYALNVDRRAERSGSAAPTATR